LVLKQQLTSEPMPAGAVSPSRTSARAGSRPNLENTMSATTHKEAADHHDKAAKSHRSAAEHHDKGDSAAAAKHATEAHGHSTRAHESSGKAHGKSSAK
jgi:hypothetical protein